MSSPFSPTLVKFAGRGNDEDGVAWGKFRTGIKGCPSIVVPLADLNTGASELWRRLGDAGIAVTSFDKKNILAQVQSPHNADRTFLVVRSPGWSRGYVTPTRVFGGPSSAIERDFGDLDLRKYRVQGTLEEWQSQVLSLCTGNSRLMFAIMCAFAGPLLELLGVGSFGFQIFGESSTGKTILLIVAGSVWGCRVGASSHLGFLETWGTTLEGGARYGRMHKDGFAPLDEIRQAGTDRDLAKLIPTFIMRLAQGTTKNQLVSVGGRGDWRLVYLGSSNLSLAQIFAAGGLVFDDAYRVRFPDIPGDAGRGYGAFEDIHGFASAAEFAKAAHAGACAYFGTASEAYLKSLATDRYNRRDWLVSRLRHATANYCAAAPAGSAADGRITDHFAVVYAAGVLARHYGILPWTREQIAWAVRTCHLAHLRHFHVEHAALDPIAAVRSYIAANLAHFRKIPDPTISEAEFAKIPGLIYTPPSGATEYAIATRTFQRCFAHLNYRRVLRALDAAGLLVRTGDRDVSKVPIRADGRTWVYRVRGVILDP
jgi:putative DNA primase/helicase